MTPPHASANTVTDVREHGGLARVHAHAKELPMQPTTITVKTLTPIWTGDAQGHADQRVQESGILGSMRWWYEVLVRGVGGRACTATGDDKCKLDPDRLPDKLPTDPNALRQVLHDAGLCDVCQLFGATGWRRRFRLVVDDSHMATSQVWRGNVEATGRSYQITDREGRPKTKMPTWYFKDGAREGTFALTIVPFGEDSTPLVFGLLQFMADWAAIGARAQMGMGVVEIAERQTTQPLYDRLVCLHSTHPPTSYDSLPNLGNLFLARIAAPSANRSQMANLRYDLRQTFRGRANETVRHSLFGTVKGSRQGSRIKVSGPYGTPPNMRIWGWATDVDQRARSFAAIRTVLDALDSNLTWREFNSPRDTARNTSDRLVFLADLLGVTP